jgi:cob(I)alamin adenosyltransferase
MKAAGTSLQDKYSKEEEEVKWQEKKRQAYLASLPAAAASFSLSRPPSQNSRPSQLSFSRKIGKERERERAKPERETERRDVCCSYIYLMGSNQKGNEKD